MAFDPISAALDIGGKLIDRLWPDPAQRDAATVSRRLLVQRMGNDPRLASSLLPVGDGLVIAVVNTYEFESEAD